MNNEPLTAFDFRTGRRFFLRLFILPGALFLLASCSPPPDQLGKLDLVKWRTDRGGCNGVRATLVDDFKTVRQELKGKSSNEIGQILGRPDSEQLDDRNQKFYIYFLEKGVHCEDPKVKTDSRSVALRISAIGLVTEITFQRGRP
ncbi:hypothetical protein [Larkinella humicola]|uniref:hypothetical protein n=1 Tax=Larkinella humicola TaxID=2607654 RepID=UPI001CD99411|nr:hypothetical protein [Larkinella humicola]